MKKSLAMLLITTGFLAGIGAGFVGGCRYRQFSLALQENKLAAGNLHMNTFLHGGTNLSPQLREFLKARIYCNVRNLYPNDSGYLLRKDWDFGAVDRQVLGKVLVWKDPERQVWDFDAALKEK
jgi:hypothetical protein